MSALYQISAFQNGDTVSAGDLVVHFPNGASRTEVVDRIAARRGYQATVPDPNDPSKTIANPQTKAQFVLAALKQFINDELRGSISNDYQATANTGVATDVAAKLP